MILKGTDPSKGNAQAARCTGGVSVNGKIGFRPLRNLENQSKPYSHSFSFRQQRWNCSEENSHFVAVGRTHGMRPDKTLGMAANCVMQCANRIMWQAARNGLHLPPHQMKFAFNGVGVHGFVSVNFCYR